jgi:hypothetical protein
VENAFKKLNHQIPPLIMKKCVSNVVTEELFMVRKCATLVISDFKRIKLLYDNFYI